MLDHVLNQLPLASGRHLVVLSGGLDSSILTLLLRKKYGSEKVVALSFEYGQRQAREIERARRLTGLIGIEHRLIDLRALGQIARDVSSNIVGSQIAVPTIHEVLGDPQPVTYVPFRNLIFLSVALAQAEALGAEHVYVGLQVHDEYGYWDTTQAFVDSVNAVAAQNRKTQIRILAPLASFSKYQEIELAKELNVLELLEHTLTCYTPNEKGESCGVCPSCSERIANFAKARVADRIAYQKDLDWPALFARFGAKT